ncbi:Helix-turn-helix motif [Anaerostipes rhamnosivorans]|jgi:predicted transcriptional regulator|uniref:Helix-turn-helix motif n=2 Tax=Anaerostipes rhamnosivorans TaxID=1229621 RepID=A0A4P8IBK3_9FIRM|nr:Helix-turn-helix motif [Anaerostipes rhamnosivorans]
MKEIERGGIMEKAKILNRLIKEQGYNLRSFASKCNMPYTTLYGIIRNGAGKASVDNVISICRHLGITVEELNNMAEGITSDKTSPSHDDLKTLIARNGKEMSTEDKMELIKMLSEL